ncbi:Modification methylase BanI [Pseudoalteromonas holothuriae]|uniref:Cytosine-specific methyltransferase n=1 Tax=Pseudoalteromonas holothuriae TaxID=2963714 RepID=A0ABM9GIF2_9GAMM|nr:DNA cytosine methyltransferase [Pseudoalteromonas sp. CIP111951]CAH9059599.1 Modification methylase BanI [Pseudoalteromonas sp. CIP111951]
MKAVELFCGIGGFRLACDELGIETVFANDIEEKASQVYRDKFSDNGFYQGDIAEFIGKIPDHDLLTGGFPCQPFSSAGKKLGIEDARGTLFEKIVEIINLKKPKYFVLENVKRLLSMDKGAHFATILNSLSDLGYLVEWRVLNAINFGLPQSRERVIIIGHLHTLPQSYLCSEEDLRELSTKQLENAATYDDWVDISLHTKSFSNWGMAYKGKFFHKKIVNFSEKQPYVKLYEVLDEQPDDAFYFNEDTLERIKNSDEVNRFYNGVEILYNQKGGARMGYSIFGTNGVAPTLTCTTSRHYERYKVHNGFRRLTNVEYARIQGFPDNHCDTATVYKQYPLYGNAVPPPMVKWAINKTINETPVLLQSLHI